MLMVDIITHFHVLHVVLHVELNRLPAVEKPTEQSARIIRAFLLTHPLVRDLSSKYGVPTNRGSPITEENVMTKLRKAMMEAMLLRGFSERTKESYIQGVRGIAAYYHLSPDGLSDEQVRHYLVYLLDERNLTYSSANLALNAIRFLFREVLHRPRNEIHLPGPRQPQRLPEILSREEVGRILEAATELRHKTLLMTAPTPQGCGSASCAICASKTSTATATASGWSRARGRRTATPCSRPTCSGSCACTGAPTSRTIGCSYTATAPTRYRWGRSRRSSAAPATRRVSENAAASIA